MEKYVKSILLILLYISSPSQTRAESLYGLCGDMWIEFRVTSDTTVCVFEPLWAQDLTPDMNLIIPEEIHVEDGRTFTVTSFNFPNGGVYYGYEYIDKIVFPKTISGSADISTLINLKSVIVEDADMNISAYASRVNRPSCQNLEYLDLGDKATGQFMDCKKLRTVKISRSLERLSSKAFSGCESLEEVIWTGTRDEDRGPMLIDGDAFRGCTSLREIELPDCVIGEYAFMDCKALEKATLENQSRITSLGKYAFSGCSSLKDIDLSCWDTLGDNSFRDCHSLTSLTLPSRIVSFGRGVFSGCENLRLHLSPDYSFESDISDNRLYIDDNDILYTIKVRNVNSREGLLPTEATMQFCPSGLAVLDLSNSTININEPGLISDIVPLTKINGALTNLSGTERISIRGDLIDGIEFLRGASSLRELTVTESMVSGFEETSPNKWELHTVKYQAEYLPSMAFSGCEKLEKVILQGYRRFGNCVFSDCRSLRDITLPSSLLVINDGTFTNCSSLRNLTLPEQITAIGANTFRNCESLEEVNIPPYVSSIGPSAFWNCSALTSVSLPDRLESIEGYAFRGCSALTEINIPASVTRLNHHAFEGCTDAKRVVIGDGISEIGDFAFNDCASAEYLEIGSKVEYVGFGALLGMDALNTIVCQSQNPPVYPTGFSAEVIENASLTVPEGCEEAYRNEYAWKPFIEGDGIGDINIDNRNKVFLTRDHVIAPDDITVWIYSIDGQIVAQGTGNFSHNLPTGLYIVRTAISISKQYIL